MGKSDSITDKKFRNQQSKIRNRNIPIVALTAYAMKGDREKTLEAGCSGYIEKPIDPETIIAQIKQVIGEEP